MAVKGQESSKKRMVFALTRTSIGNTLYYGCTVIRKGLCFIHYDWNISLSGHKQYIQILHYYCVWQYLPLIMEFPSEFHFYYGFIDFYSRNFRVLLLLVWDEGSLKPLGEFEWLHHMKRLLWGLLYSKGFLWVIEHTLPQERRHLSFTFKIYKCVSKNTKSFEEKPLLISMIYQ